MTKSHSSAKEFLTAAREGDYPSVRTFLEQGMDVNTQDPQTGNTALHIAVWLNSPVLAQLLLDYDARTDIRNKYQRLAISETSYPNETRHLIEAHNRRQGSVLGVAEHLFASGWRAAVLFFTMPPAPLTRTPTEEDYVEVRLDEARAAPAHHRHMSSYSIMIS